ncbi:MAG: divergent PAP2 family protein [Treponema sp.]|nr:divergent PAP2 family protein [Treponema sp.]MBR1614699.1 divergent PAP2 family protein [Treponema sp.]
MLSSAGGQLHALLTSPVFLACVFSWLCAQFLKTVIKLFSGKVHSLFELFELMFWQTGGMPSSHSAVVSCVCTCVGFRSGVDSDVFIVSFILFFITIRDALGVRRSNGVQAHRLNQIISLLNGRKKQRDDVSSGKPDAEQSDEEKSSLASVKEVNGHTPMEVFVGSLLGLFIGIAFSVLN